MTQVLENISLSKPAGQSWICRGLEWHQFKAIQASFEGVPNVRLFYCQGVLEIVTIGKPHEAIRCLLALLLGLFFMEKNIEFFPAGSHSQIVENVVEYQSDLSYCFESDKEVSDLCVEVVITSGSPIKLEKYQEKGVAEVWFWEDGTFELYRLRESGYEQISSSEFLPELDLSLLNRCLLMASPLQAIKEFRNNI